MSHLEPSGADCGTAPPDPNASIRDPKTGRWLVLPPKMRENQWKKGIGGNPTGGHSHAYLEAVSLARGRSAAVVQRMVELAELDNVDENGKLAPLSRRADARVAALASQWLWECAWGKNRSPDKLPGADQLGVTIEQRKEGAMATLQAAFERVIQASKAQAAETQQPAEDRTKDGSAAVVEIIIAQ